jgi:localization factor PodJL
MKPGGPWSVKGIEPEMREAAKNAARRSGMTLGEWLNSAISDQADGATDGQTEVGSMATTATNQTPSESFDRAAARLEDIAQQLSRIARQESDAATAYSYGQGTPRQDTESVSRLVSRVENNERQSVEAFSAVNERLSVLSRQFAQATKAGSSVKVEEAPGFQALERAVRNIVEHMEASEKRNRDHFRSLQDRMADLASTASASNDESLLRQAPAIAQLEGRLGDLARRVEATDSSIGQQLQEIVRREVQGLSGRIDQVRETAEQMAASAHSQAVQSNQQEMRAIEQRVLGLLQETQNTFSSNLAPQVDLSHIEQRIAELHSRTEQSRQGVASDHDVRALRQAVEQLSTRVSQTSDTRPIVEMDRRIVELAQRLHDTQQSIPQYNDLDQRFADLETRFGQALQASSDPAVIHGLQQQIAQVNDRVARAESQVSNFESIERAITQLYEGLEQTRNTSRQVAEEAASRVAEQFANQFSGQFSGQPSQPFSLAGAPEIAALEQGLRAVRDNLEHTDQRNQETLVAVHDTLEQIVNKLGELETAAIGQRVAAAVSAPVAAAAQEPTISYSQISEPSIAFAPEPSIPRHEEQVQPDIAAVDSFVPSIDPQPDINSFTVPEPAASNSVTAEEAAETDDFIKLARQAQAASQNKSLLDGISPSAARLSEEGSKKLLSKFKFPFIGKKKVKPTKAMSLAESLELPKAPPPIKPAVEGQSKRLKYIALGALVLALAAAAIQNLGGSSEPQPITTSDAGGLVTPESAKTASAEATPAVQAQATEPVAEAPAAAAVQNNQQEEQQKVEAPIPGDDVATASLSKPAQPVAAVSPEQSDILTEAARSAEALAALPAAIGPTKLKAAAASGDAKAQFVIATQLMDGTAVSQDQSQAAYWFGRAAKADLAPAQYRLATLYERGMGVEKDMKAAMQWYERAAALGNVRSMHNAAVLAANNEAGPADYDKAFKWFSLASNHGLKDSQFNLAVLLERGLGTKADKAEALFWYSAAAMQNDDDARRRADLLAASMPGETVAAVNERLASWKPQIAPQSANVIDVNLGQWKESALQPNDDGSLRIAAAQGLLQQLGYSIGSENGILSVRTINAIKLFQIEQGLVADGQLTPQLVGLMQSQVG